MLSCHRTVTIVTFDALHAEDTGIFVAYKLIYI